MKLYLCCLALIIIGIVVYYTLPEPIIAEGGRYIERDPLTVMGER